MDLSSYDNSDYSRGRHWAVEMAWMACAAFFVNTWIPGSHLRVLLLRAFGARIGKGVVVKPRARIKFPWKLRAGDHVWFGENCWIDNIFEVSIGNNVCISQDVYICTGNHDWNSPSFTLKAGEIKISDGAWLAARSVVSPGTTVNKGAVLGIGSVALSDLEANGIYVGNPARKIKVRANYSAHP